ncbi:MAG: hypothetical protein CJBNEKGG_00590 [Prosthecobacter sp.]|nr:hypothetical protein [Prosthecobacter sp.]
MTHEEARLELDATTLRPQDLSEEARTLLEQDAALAAWTDRRRSFDERVAGAMPEEVPAGLRERLLVLDAGSRHRTVWKRTPWFAAAAAVLLLGGLLVRPGPGPETSWQDEAMVVVRQLEHGRTRLTERAGSLEALRGYLDARHSPSPGRMPGRMDQTRTFGCKLIQAGGHPATIICFQLEDGREAHLVIIENAGPRGRPPEEPKLTALDGWNLAAWSDGPVSYLLATTADAAALKRLLGLG